ncbi:hypothetical protein GC096_18740 [Paenibacillus sp. LMG 31461]|uniref:Carbohydrate kinase FGGY N-terminal domain-containing protein n=1 Tax=Paenibacillus plantarum TaxID=2654975 RepID=A0ABX1XCG8_9BACL|nr:FGGY family carbohydrate kinase [Paenibacillus plantarum]NOU66077.1 hypothetical protein [Paenibacillus plantarum]
MSYLGIDIGSSFIKSALLDTTRLQISGTVKIPTPGPLPNDKNYIFELDPHIIVKMITTMIEERVKLEGPIEGILLSTQMHGFVLADQSGEPLTNYISWRDTRGTYSNGNETQSSLEFLSQFLTPEKMSRCGTRLKSGLAACNLHHWIMNNPDQIKRKDISFCTLGSFLIYKLTGRNACHLTNAAATGFADPAKRAWNQDIIYEVGCDSFTFPDLLSEHEVCGYFGSTKGSIPVFPDIGDHQATVYGALKENTSIAVISGGTAGIVSVVTNEATAGDYENRPYFNNQYLRTVTQLPGGRNLDVLVDFIEEIGSSIYQASITKEDIWQKILQSLSVANQASSLESIKVELGFFKEQKMVKHGRIDNIREGNLTSGSLFRAAFENLADNFITALNKLADSTVQIQRIYLTGGLLHNNSLIQSTIQDLTGIETIPSNIQEEALTGLLHIAVKIANG